MKKLFYFLPFLLTACTSGIRTSQVLLTAESGEKCTEVAPITFKKVSGASVAPGAVVVDVNNQRQTLDGYGASLTEASAFVLACLPVEQRQAILHELFSEEGANFSAVRTQIGASDFSVEGCYSLAEEPGDTALLSFSLNRDKEGFSREKYPQIVDEHYDLYHLMKDVQAIKNAQADKAYRIIANTWTAPAWMKDNNAYYERDWSRDLHRGGILLPQYYQAYANYLVKYLQAYREEGIEVWALTPVNEPMGNDGGWESMDMNPAAEAEFIGKYMGPALQANGFGDIEILGFDQNIFEMGPYTEAIYGDSLANAHTAGMAIHWYGSTFSCFPEVLDSIHNCYPDKKLMHTEGCIDNLGCPAWDAVTDPVGFTESGWFGNDAFWWQNKATDWAYSTPYWPELHPAYSAVQRYAQYIIEGMNHWMTGFTDWNIVLDSIGGPNHVQNYCGAPVMVNYSSPEQGRSGGVYYTPYYYVLKQFSRLMRPGDVALAVTPTGNPDLFVSAALTKADREGSSVVVHVLNKSAEPITFPLTILTSSPEQGRSGGVSSEVTAPANSVLSLVLPQ